MIGDREAQSAALLRKLRHAGGHSFLRVYRVLREEAERTNGAPLNVGTVEDQLIRMTLAYLKPNPIGFHAKLPGDKRR